MKIKLKKSHPRGWMMLGSHKITTAVQDVHLSFDEIGILKTDEAKAWFEVVEELPARKQKDK